MYIAKHCVNPITHRLYIKFNYMRRVCLVAMYARALNCLGSLGVNVYLYMRVVGGMVPICGNEIATNIHNIRIDKTSAL